MRGIVAITVCWGEAKGRIQPFLRAESAATAMEYALLASGIAIGILVAVASLGGSVQGMFTDVSTAIDLK